MSSSSRKALPLTPLANTGLVKVLLVKVWAAVCSTILEPSERFEDARVMF